MRRLIVAVLAVLGCAALFVAAGLVFEGTAIAAEGDGLIVVSDPTKDGSVKILLQCVDKDGKTETISLSVAILASHDRRAKGIEIEDAIEKASPKCFMAYYAEPGNLKLLVPKGNRMTTVLIEEDDTAETIAGKCVTSLPARGRGSFWGTPAGGTATVAVEPVTVVTVTTAKTASQIMQDLVTELNNEGVGAEFGGNQITITGDLANLLFSVGTTDFGLTFSMDLRCPPPVGGITELLVDGPDGPRSAAEGSASSFPYAALAGGLAAAVALATAGGWYARRRFRQRRIST